MSDSKETTDAASAGSSPKPLRKGKTMLATLEEAKQFLGSQDLTEKRRRTRTQPLVAEEPAAEKKSPTTKKRRSPNKSPGEKKGRKNKAAPAEAAAGAVAAPAAPVPGPEGLEAEPTIPETRRMLKRGDSFVMEGSLGKIVIGLGWDSPFDLDASCLVYDKKHQHLETISYMNLKSSKFQISHSGDIITPKVAGTTRDDEKITIELLTLPAEVSVLVITVNVYTVGKTFAEVKNAYVRLIDADKREERCRFEIDSNFGDKTGLIMCKVFRLEGESQWRLMPIGEPTEGRRANEMMPYLTKYLPEDYVPEGCTVTVLS